MSDVNLPMNNSKTKLTFCNFRPLAAAAMILCMGMQTVKAADQDWWFDVEVIIFKRDTSVTELSEKFVNNKIKAPSSQVLDLLTPYLQADLTYLRAGLPFCRASERAKKQQQYESDFAFPQPPAAATDNESVSQVASEVAKAPLNIAQDDFQYQVASNDIFAEQDSEPKQPAAELDGTAQDSNADLNPEIPAQDLSVNWIEWQIPQQVPCVYREQLALLANPFEPQDQPSIPLAKLDAVPVKINGMTWQHKGQAFLLPQSDLTLASLFKDINKQHDLQTILHMGWRQEVKFGQENAQPLRLFAGKNYGQEFLTDGHKRPKTPLNNVAEPYIPFAERQELSEQAATLQQDQAVYQHNADLFSTLHQVLNNEQALELKTPIVYQKTIQRKSSAQTAQDLALEPIWQLEGELKVYLQNVGATPYLHIESNLDFRQPVFDPSLIIDTASDEATNDGRTVMLGNQSREPNVLESVNFNQYKRVISKQLHYFDHPLFGMVVYITRYNWPAESQSAQ